MNTSRLAASLLIRTPRASVPKSARQFRTVSRQAPRIQSNIASKPQLRFYSQAEKPTKFYTFQEIQKLSQNPNPSTILIDTREPSELQSTGTIPTSLNIPVTSKPDSFFITAEEFEDRFGFERPGKETEVVFYCRAGVRSRAAAGLARQAGWTNVSEYAGSWLDWEKNGGERESVK